MSTDADAEKPKSAAPPEGTPCWLEIPARDVDKLKVGNGRSSLCPVYKC